MDDEDSLTLEQVGQHPGHTPRDLGQQLLVERYQAGSQGLGEGGVGGPAPAGGAGVRCYEVVFD